MNNSNTKKDFKNAFDALPELCRQTIRSAAKTSELTKSFNADGDAPVVSKEDAALAAKCARETLFYVAVNSLPAMIETEEDLDTLDSIITRMIANFDADRQNGAEDK